MGKMAVLKRLRLVGIFSFRWRFIKMGFVVDKVSEDSFYENLLLGLSKVLEKNPCVSKITLKRLQGLRQVDIRAWEHNNGVILPEDLRSFYSSTNGFLFTYEFSYDYHASSEEEKDFKLGLIQINPMTDFIRTFGYETKNTAQVDTIGKKKVLSLSRESKVFELANIDDNAKVVWVYPTTYSVPAIWFYSGQMHFSYLAEDFTTYFRMCIAHLGIPCWQYAFSKEGLPEWSKEMFTLIAPGILSEDRNLIDSHSYKYSIEHTNKIDPNIFNITPQSCVALPSDRQQSQARQPAENKNKDKGKNRNLARRVLSCKGKRGGL
ncbi:tubulin polyglutamylase complex subunit 2 isoform X2 [Anthonomus grandis grandis]|uniref:tubulin polyglutamylase complex subunit 2 isoform X2 n=1 Tax=Anthonomus grandis grandis TaxID=2921223 RepID=UPI002165D60D|nr:tubulin polyglutamylase complex subunit 2 isoform X2 [Anthonomus grandis grandis]